MEKSKYVQLLEEKRIVSNKKIGQHLLVLVDHYYYPLEMIFFSSPRDHPINIIKTNGKGESRSNCGRPLEDLKFVWLTNIIELWF